MKEKEKKIKEQLGQEKINWISVPFKVYEKEDQTSEQTAGVKLSELGGLILQSFLNSGKFNNPSQFIAKALYFNTDLIKPELIDEIVHNPQVISDRKIKNKITNIAELVDIGREFIEYHVERDKYIDYRERLDRLVIKHSFY